MASNWKSFLGKLNEAPYVVSRKWIMLSINRVNLVMRPF
jgi:hypothetical protein